MWTARPMRICRIRWCIRVGAIHSGCLRDRFIVRYSHFCFLALGLKSVSRPAGKCKKGLTTSPLYIIIPFGCQHLNRSQTKLQKNFESTEISALVGIQPFYLNKFIERKQYGIESSLRAGKGRGSRRLFSEDDVFGVALVWWLFESGLRSGAIQYVLNQICGGRLKSKASDASRILAERGAEALAVMREPRKDKDANRGYPKQVVFLLKKSQLFELIEKANAMSLLVIPIGNLFARLMESMRKL